MLSDDWKKSPYSVNGGECVEARVSSPGSADVRDTVNPDHGHLTFPASEWRALLAAESR